MAIKPVGFNVSPLNPGILLQGAQRRPSPLDGVLDSVLNFRFNQQLREQADAAQLAREEAAGERALERDFLTRLNDGSYLLSKENLDEEGFVPGPRLPGEEPIRRFSAPVESPRLASGPEYIRAADVAAVRNQRYLASPAGFIHGYDMSDYTIADVTDADGNVLDIKEIEAMRTLTGEEAQQAIDAGYNAIDPSQRAAYTASVQAALADGSLTVADLKNTIETFTSPQVLDNIRRTSEEMNLRRREDDQQVIVDTNEIMTNTLIRHVDEDGAIIWEEPSPREAMLIATLRSVYGRSRLSDAEFEEAARLNADARPAGMGHIDLGNVSQTFAVITDPNSNARFAKVLDSAIRSGTGLGPGLKVAMTEAGHPFNNPSTIAMALAEGNMQNYARYLALYFSGAGDAETLVQLFGRTGGAGAPYNSQQIWDIGAQLNPNFNPNGLKRPSVVPPAGTPQPSIDELEETTAALQPTTAAAAQAFIRSGLAAYDVFEMLPEGDPMSAAQQLRAAADAITQGGTPSAEMAARAETMRKYADFLLKYDSYYDTIRASTLANLYRIR